MNFVAQFITIASVYHFAECLTIIKEDSKLTEPRGRRRNDFGFPVAVHKDFTFVSSIRDYDAKRTGSVHVYNNQLGFQYMTRVLPKDGKAYQHFGKSIAVNDRYIVIGSRQDNGKRGSVYVYETRDGGQGNFAKLVANDGKPSDYFGTSVDINSDNVIVVGANRASFDDQNSGAVYIFTFNGRRWVQRQKIVPRGADSYWQIGRAVSISNKYLAISASGKTHSNKDIAGAVYIYTKTRSGFWRIDAGLTSPDPEAFGQFGRSVSISDTRIIVGAPVQRWGKGNAYIFVKSRRGRSWPLETRLKPNKELGHGIGRGNFGFDVHMQNNRAVVGVYKDSMEHGAVYLYELVNGKWVEKGIFEAKRNEFVKSVRVYGKTVVVGCQIFNPWSGAAYVVPYP